MALPEGLSSLVRGTASQVIGSAGTAYDKALALQDFFRKTGGFTYDLSVQPGHSDNAIDDFLARAPRLLRAVRGHVRGDGPFGRAAGTGGGRLHARDQRSRQPATVRGQRRAHARLARGLPGPVRLGGLRAHARPRRSRRRELHRRARAAGRAGADRTDHHAHDRDPHHLADDHRRSLPGCHPRAAGPVPRPRRDRQHARPGSRTWPRSWLLLALASVAYALVVPGTLALRRRRRRHHAITPDQQVVLAWTESQERLAIAGEARRQAETASEYASRAARVAPLPREPQGRAARRARHAGRIGRRRGLRRRRRRGHRGPVAAGGSADQGHGGRHRLVVAAGAGPSRPPPAVVALDRPGRGRDER